MDWKIFCGLSKSCRATCFTNITCTQQKQVPERNGQWVKGTNIHPTAVTWKSKTNSGSWQKGQTLQDFYYTKPSTVHKQNKLL
jgi:hypothetical protein